MGVRGCGLPGFCARSVTAATNLREWPRPRPGRDIVMRRVKDVRARSAYSLSYAVAAPSLELNGVPDFHMA